MKSETWRLLAARSLAVNASAHQLDALIVGGSLLGLLLLIVANSIIVRHAAERTRAEDDLRESARRDQNLFETPHEGIVLNKGDETNPDCKPAFERITGWPRKKLLGLRLRTAFPPDPA